MENLAGLGKALPAKPGKKAGKKPPKEEEEEDDDEEDPDFEVTETNIPGFNKAQLAAMLAGGKGELAAALQQKLDSMAGRSSGYIESLPGKVKRRIEKLKELQEEHDKLEEKFMEERRALEKKYEALYQPLYDKRSAVVTGKEDVEHPADDTEEAKDAEGNPIVGIPEFWLNALRNNEVLEEVITDKDAEALAFLTDVRCEELDTEELKGFRLTFDFKENPFFTNTTLTKTYVMEDLDDPILEKSIGTEINWHPGKNLTVKVMKKKPKKGAKNAKPVTKTEPCESFFNFFSPPAVPEEEEEIDDPEALQDALEQDYEMGAAIRERIIPNAVDWFTGEALEDYYGEEEDEGEEDEDEEDDDEDEEEEDEKPKKKGGKKGKGGGAAGAGGEQPAECKNQ